MPAPVEEGAVETGSRSGENERVTPLVWLYRGAWQEWETYRTDVFLPLSKDDLDRKIISFLQYQHKSV